MAPNFLFFTLITLAVTHNLEFPLHDFMNIDKSVDLNPTRKLMLCENKTKHDKVMCCSCDRKNCARSLSCCVDIHWRTQNFTSVLKYREFLVKLGEEQRRQCLPVFPVKTELNSELKSRKYIMVNRCQPTANMRDKKLCSLEQTSIQDLLPVFTTNNTLYKNRHCAACNGVKSFQFVSLGRDCQTLPCEYRLELSQQIRFSRDSCDDGSIGACQKSSHFYHGCKSYNSPLREFYCTLCAYDSGDDETPDIFYPFSIENGGKCIRDGMGPTIPISWSYTLKLNSQFAKETDRTKVCQSDDSYKRFLNGECIYFNCPAGYKVNGDTTCEEIPTIHSFQLDNKSTFDSCLSSASFNIYFVNLTNPLKFVEYFERKSEEVKYFKLIYNDTDLVIINLQKRREENIATFIRKELGQIAPHLGQNGRLFLTPLHHPLPYSKIDMFKIFPKNKICASRPVLMRNISFSENCDIIHNGSLHQNWKVSIWIEIKDGAKTMTRNAYMCDNLYSPLNCSLRLLDSKTSILKNNSLLHRKNKNNDEQFDAYQYLHIEDNKYAVCHSDVTHSSPPSFLTNVYIAEGYVSIIGSIFSLISYVSITGIIYMTKELQNVPGFYIIVLSVSLFLSDGLFLCTNFIRLYEADINAQLCEIIGLLMHFFLLMSHFVGSCFVLFVVNNITAMQSLSGKRTFFASTGICLLISILIILIGMQPDIRSLLDADYKKDGVCILHGFYARLLLLYVPLVTSNIISWSLLAVTMYRLSTALKRSREILQNSRVKAVKLCHVVFRLILVCGMSEIFGFLYIHGSNLNDGEKVFNAVFGFVYSVIKSCRGVPLLIVFVARKKAISTAQENRARSSSAGTID